VLNEIQHGRCLCTRDIAIVAQYKSQTAMWSVQQRWAETARYRQTPVGSVRRRRAPRDCMHADTSKKTERERERENGKRTMLSVVMVVLPSRFA